MRALSEFLGDGGRGEGFEDFTAMVEGALKDWSTPDKQEDKDTLRLIKLFMVAAVEGCNKMGPGLTGLQQLQIVSFAAGYCSLIASMSVMDEKITDNPESMAELGQFLVSNMIDGIEQASINFANGKDSTP